jgi:hypothetical protein
MSDLSALKSRFLSAFESTAHKLSIDRSDIRKGYDAVGDIFDQVAEPLSYAPVLSPFFAGHDLSHPVRLASVVEDLLTKNSPKPDSPLRNIDCLVLLFSSLLLHDVGMALMDPELVDEDWTEIWHGHLVRPKHDEKSLLFIEEKLVPASVNMHGWSKFWDERPDAPTPAGRWALFLVARVCQSHGDPVEDWLTPESFEKYIARGSGFKDDLEDGFRAIWGSEAWDAQKRAALAAGAMLSFVDLCDIAHDRFPSPGDEYILNRIVPEQPRARQTALLHWIGHRVGRVSFALESVRYEVGSPLPRSKLRLRLPFEWGPGADLLRWGNEPRLLESLQRFAGVTISSVAGYPSSIDEETWKEIEKASEKDIFRECWPFHEINRRIHEGDKALDFAIVAPRWWESAVGKEFQAGTFFPISFLIDLRTRGLLIEDLFKPKEIQALKQATPAAVVFVDPDRSAFHFWYVGDSFAAAIRLARGWMTHNKNIQSLRLAIKGNAVHRDLRDGNIDKYSNSVILCAIARRNPGVLGEYSRISDHIIKKGAAGNVRIIFFGGDRQAVDELEQGGVIPVEFRISESRLKALTDYIAETGVEERATSSSSRSSRNSRVPTEVLFKFNLQEKGSVVFVDTILSIIEDGLHGDARQALGVVLFLTLYELLDVMRTGLSIEVLEREYEEVRKAVEGGVAIPVLSEAYELVMDTKLLIFSQDVVLAGEPRDAVGVALVQISSSSISAFLLQLAVFYRLQAAGISYNVNSHLFISSLPVVLTTAAINCIFDEEVSLDFRIRIGLGLAERVASRPDALMSEVHSLVKEVAQKTGDLETYGDFIGFQMVYRLARGLWIKDLLAIEREELLSLDDPIVNLGILEALASENTTNPEMVRSSDQEFLDAVLDFFKDMIEGAAEAVPVAAYMAYDIICHYRQSSPLLRTIHPFYEVCIDLGWEAVGPHFHEEDRALEGPDDLARIWKDMRSRFIEILDGTPASMRREEVADLLRARVE